MNALELIVSDTKKASPAYKEKLLNDIKFYEKKLEEIQIKTSQACGFEDEEDSSDSDTSLLLPLNIGPTITQMNLKRSNLSVCLQATQELTRLQVVESEVNVVVDTPELDNRTVPPIGGTWKEVTAECRVDLVPFSITFSVHQPNAKFAARSYHNLRVTAVKAAHDIELSQSVLGEVRTPSDAVQVIRSYAVAHRSRRTTLAWLAKQFADTLFMETTPTGGYLLKCAGALRVSWTLQNKWSHIAAFHHRMKFDLEYMDEQYLKEIKYAYNELIDPTIETDERTALLAKIFDICLEVTRNPTESDTDTEGRSRRTTLEAEPEMPPARKRLAENPPEVEAKRVRNKDSEVMAPPKQLPKRGKPKGKTSAVGAKGKEGPVENDQKVEVSSENGQSDKHKRKENAKGVQKDGEKTKDNQRVKNNAANGLNAKDNREKVKEKDVNERKVKEKAVSVQKSSENGAIVPKNKENLQKPKDIAENGGKDTHRATEVLTSKESMKPVQKDKKNNANTQKVVKKPSNQIKNVISENGEKDKHIATEVLTSKESTIPIPKDKKNNANAQKAVKKPSNHTKNAETVLQKPLQSDDVKNTEVNNVKAKESTINAKKDVNTKTKAEIAKKAAKRPLHNNDENNLKGKEKTANTNSDVVSKKTKTTEARTEGNTNKVENTNNVADIHPKESNKEQNKKSKTIKKFDKLVDNNPRDKVQNEKSDEAVDKDRVNHNAVTKTKSKPDTKRTETAKETGHEEKIISGNKVQSELVQTKTKHLQNTNENDKNVQNKAKTLVLTDKNKISDKTVKSTKNNKILEQKMPGKITKIPLKTAQSIPKMSVPSRNALMPSGAGRAPSTNFWTKGSKIPRNPLRISPRKTPSTVKAGLTVGGPKQNEAMRNSPRLLKKPTVKPTSMFVF